MTPASCLNCGADLNGAFCGACGQRSVPANPTVAELAGDAWQELSGYDGRIASTFRGLMRPGHLTLEYLQGRRLRYLPPVRLYLIASVIYFLIAAAAPADPTRSPAEVRGPGSLRIGLWDDTANQRLTPEQRAELQAEIDASSWPIRMLWRAIQSDPAAFRLRLFTVMPRVFFGMLPVFAGIVWLFYRRRFPTALVFATHVHAVAFLVFAFSEAAKQTAQPAVIATVGVLALVAFAVYALRAMRAVFGGSWPITALKAVGIGVVYLFSSIPAFFIVLVWASLT